MSGGIPQTPAEVPQEVALDVVLAQYQWHLVVLARARAGREPDVDLARHALAALSLGQALVDDIVTERWPAVHDGLAHGATVAAVSAALGGLGADEIRAGLSAWADRQHRSGGLSDVEHDTVLALLAGVPGELAESGP